MRGGLSQGDRVNGAIVLLSVIPAKAGTHEHQTFRKWRSTLQSIPWIYGVYGSRLSPG